MDQQQLDGGVNAIVVGGQQPAAAEDPVHHGHIRTALVSGVGAAVAAGRGYTLVRATSQVVAGSLHAYYIRFDGDEDALYKITAWSRPWLKDPAEALQITFVGRE